MQSASDTPSSHLREPSRHADQRGVWRGGGRRANPGLIGCQGASRFGTGSPKSFTSDADTPVFLGLLGAASIGFFAILSGIGLFGISGIVFVGSQQPFGDVVDFLA